MYQCQRHRGGNSARVSRTQPSAHHGAECPVPSAAGSWRPGEEGPNHFLRAHREATRRTDRRRASAADALRTS